ncbi:P pilus assembly protein, chaperone PapD [Collimonas sp. OK307]|uniref:fimbria/pilus chaperone family protein n=1 Tax=Collimonas sp. OK307 TaxID=1801620 RepID=UPI0008F0EA58|nr:P pilus assembly protein, chaperone PapD [Collimonas sp. OK307]
MFPNKFPIKRFIAIGLMASFFSSSFIYAAGVVPDTSVVILQEADGEVSLVVQNTDKTPVLLHTSIVNLPEDKDQLIIVNPPVIRVEAGAKQLVRFMLQNDNGQPLTTQRLRRVILEGLPPKAKRQGDERIGVSTRQNIPLLINPKSLPMEREPWKLLTWHSNGGQLSLKNSSPYVVRMAQSVQLLPQDMLASLPRTYILPGETLQLTSEVSATRATTGVRMSPATVYGFVTKTYDAPLQHEEAVTP